MAEAAEAEPLAPWELVRQALGLPLDGPPDKNLSLCIAATTSYIERYHGVLTVWPADYQIGAIKLAVGLYRDALTPGIAEPFAQGNVYKRATDVEIEQLLRIGRYAVPGIG